MDVSNGLDRDGGGLLMKCVGRELIHGVTASQSKNFFRGLNKCEIS